MNALARQKKFDYLVIESSGISEPMPVAETFTFSEHGTVEVLSEVARLDTMVTVVDGFNFLKDYQTSESLLDRKMEAFKEDDRTIVHLLTDQVEFANVIVLNKVELLSTSELGDLRRLLRFLNPGAKIIETSWSNVPLAEVINTRSFSFEKAQAVSGWLQEAREGEHNPETLEYGIASFVYRAHRPFHPTRLYELLHLSEPLQGVLRSKGFCWLATRMRQSALWSQAGRIYNLTEGPVWWAEVPEKQWPEGVREVLDKVGSKEFGDRQQELVIIGREMDNDKISERVHRRSHRRRLAFSACDLRCASKL